MKPAYLKSASGMVTVYAQSKVHSVTPDHPNYAKILDVLTSEGPYDSLPDLMNLAKKVVAAIGNAAGLVVEAGQVLFNGMAVHNTVVDRILQFAEEKFDNTRLVKFLGWLVQNPSKASFDNLYRFMEHNNMVITEDGCFLAYKRVNAEYKDIYTKKVDNSVGQVVKMPRFAVQDDPNVTCSFGLHVASLDYAKNHYSSSVDGQSDKLVVVKVNPRDVVSVPTDYANSKMRVCEYEVVSDFEHEFKQSEFSTPVVATERPIGTGAPPSGYATWDDWYKAQDEEDWDERFDDELDDEEDLDSSWEDDYDDEDEDEDDYYRDLGGNH